MIYECVFDGRKQSSSRIIGFRSNLEILRFNPEAAEYIYIQLPLKGSQEAGFTLWAMMTL